MNPSSTARLRAAAPPARARGDEPARTRRRLPRPRVATVALHRWATLAFGLLVLFFTTTGAIALYQDELRQVTDGGLFHRAGLVNTVDFGGALEIADGAGVRADGKPATAETAVYRRGVYDVYMSDDVHHVYVDATSGHVNGVRNAEKGLIANIVDLHECLAMCGDEQLFGDNDDARLGAIPLVRLVPWVRDRGIETSIIGFGAILLSILVVTGAVLWWPGIRGFLRKGFSVRWRRNAYIKSFDLHKTIGIAALPLLAMFAFTGANFEFDSEIGRAYYFVTAQHAPPDPPTVASTPGPGPGIDGAMAAKLIRTAEPHGRLISLIPPDRSDPTSVWSGWMAKRWDQYGRSQYPGNVYVEVDRYNGTVLSDTARDSQTSRTVALYTDWTSSLHMAQSLSGWWKLIWLVAGLSPLALAVTGILMWLLRRRSRRRRDGRRAEAMA